jgi:hypothetical protein
MFVLPLGTGGWKLKRAASRQPLVAHVLVRLLRFANFYFLRRKNAPAASEPMPSNPSSGSGEAVCGRLEPALLLF